MGLVLTLADLCAMTSFCVNMYLMMRRIDYMCQRAFALCASGIVSSGYEVVNTHGE